MYIVTAFALANCLIRYAAWLTRNRWSGRLLLNLSPPGRRLTWRNIHPASHHGIFWELSLLFWIVTGPWSRMTMPVQSYLDRVVKLSWGIMVLASSFYVLQGQLELREQGIVCRGKLFRWRNIESYHRGPPKESLKEYEFLRLRLRRLLKILPPTQIAVPAERRSDADAVLSRYLSYWPTDINHQP